MPKLHQILGSLFSDIAQSVFTSDLYSRDISRYYEQDGLLRHFPVPRTEISELELDLKFAISEIELNPAQGIEREANVAPIFLDFSYTLSESFYKELRNILDEPRQNTPTLAKKPEEVAWGVETIYLRQDLLKYFQHQHRSLIEEGKFQVDKAREEIWEILHDKVYYRADKDEELTATVLKRIKQAIHLKSGLEALVKPLRFAWNQAGDFRMEVEITAEKLGELNGEQLSSVHIRTRVRNYKWSEVEHPDRRPWWTLNPE